MSYPEPNSLFKRLSLSKSTTNSQAQFNSDLGISLGVEVLNQSCICLQLGFDGIDPSIRKQIFTGAEKTQERSKLTIAENAEAIELSAGPLSISFKRSEGQFCIKRGNEIQLSSHSAPFSGHFETVQLQEGIQSLKVTSWPTPTPFVLEPHTYSTHMFRFQYKRPVGSVLGLPGQSGEFDRNGYRFELFNTDQFYHIPSRLPMYQSWPILLHRAESGTGWVAIFHDNPSRTFVDLGDFYPELVTFESVTNASRVYIICEETLELVSQKLVNLLGGIQLPPAWAFGYQQCRFSYMSTTEIRDVSKRMVEHEIPLDAMYFDIDYMHGYRVFTNDPERFSDIGDCITELNALGIKTVGIVDPGLKVDENYTEYNYLKESGEYLKNKDGTPFIAKVWPGASLLPDFGSTKASTLWADAQNKWLKRIPLDGVWNDMNEPSNFDGGSEKVATTLNARGTQESEFNLYGLHQARASRQGWEKHRPQDRGLIITRSGYPGVQQHAMIWHGDNFAWWEHLKLALNTAITYSVMGAYFTGPDVPGFFGNPPDDLAVRFFQLGSWLPFFRGHSFFQNKDKEPTAFHPDAAAIIKETIRSRYSLAREWYSGFEKSIRMQQAPLKPVHDSGGKLVEDQFTLFDKFLVAPVIQRNQLMRAVYLPSGSWYSLGDTATMHKGNSWILVPTTLKDVPVFVRAGSIVTRNEIENNFINTLKASERHEIYANEGGEAKGYWYSDDGISIHDKKSIRKEFVKNSKDTKLSETFISI